jgi:hypothetical protein
MDADMNGRTVSTKRGRFSEQCELWGGSELRLHDAHRPQVVRRLGVNGRWNTGFAAALAIVVEEGRKAQRSNQVPQTACCPRCGRDGLTERDFGTRVMANGQVRTQSWCRACRSNKHLVPKARGQEDWLSWASAP